MPGSKSPTLKTFSIAMRFDASCKPRALELLVSASGPIRAKRGCRSCRVENDAVDPDRLHYEEEWDSEEAFRRHVRSEEFWRVLLATDLCCEEPEVAIGDLSVQYGMDTLRKLREAPPGPN